MKKIVFLLLLMLVPVCGAAADSAEINYEEARVAPYTLPGK